MTNPASPIESFRRAVTAACSPLGIKAHEVQVSGRAITIPSANLTINAELANGVRVWRAVEKMTIVSVADDSQRETTLVLFEEPFKREWQVAKRIAMHIAESRINCAIDDAVPAT